MATGEFIRRFLLHVLPDGLHRNRHYGLLASAQDKTSGARRRAPLSTVPLLRRADAPQLTRARWLERLIDAIEDDGVDYLAPIAERFAPPYPPGAHRASTRSAPYFSTC